MSAISFTDSSLRDGSHTIGHRFTVEQAGAIAARLAAGGVPVIEVSHGDGLGGSSFNYGFGATDELALVAAAAEAAPQAAIAVLLLPGIGLATDLATARDAGASVARIATHCTEADISAQHIATSRELGLQTCGFLMMSHRNTPSGLAEQAQLMESYGAEVVYVVDSAGALVPSTTRERVDAVRATLDPQTHVGFHAHDNLGAAIANTLAALDTGATYVDGSLAGLGAGAGNLATELFAAVTERSGIATGLDTLALADAAGFVVELLGVAPARSRSTTLLGYAGVYSSFLLHTERAAARFGVDSGALLVALGERGVVGGQEDMIIDVAAELVARG
jgi:4-hydroxy 2-oxovalerate aldolase